MSTEKTQKHSWLAQNGEVAASMEDAIGIRYVTDAGEVVDIVINPEQYKHLAMFGARTLATNTISSFYGPREGKGADAVRPRRVDAPDTDAMGLRDRFAAITADSWGAERGGGAGGVGYNLEDLLEALVEVMTAQAKAVNRDKVAGALRDGGTLGGNALDARAYRKAIYGIAGVKEAYQAIRAAKAGPATDPDEVADDLA